MELLEKRKRKNYKIYLKTSNGTRENKPFIHNNIISVKYYNVPTLTVNNLLI